MAVLDKWRCLPISQIWPNFEFFNNFLYQIEIQKGYILDEQKLPSRVFRALWDGRFLKKHGCWSTEYGPNIFLPKVAADQNGHCCPRPLARTFLELLYLVFDFGTHYFVQMNINMVLAQMYARQQRYLQSHNISTPYASGWKNIMLIFN